MKLSFKWCNGFFLGLPAGACAVAGAVGFSDGNLVSGSVFVLASLGAFVLGMQHRECFSMSNTVTPELRDTPQKKGARAVVGAFLQTVALLAICYTLFTVELFALFPHTPSAHIYLGVPAFSATVLTFFWQIRIAAHKLVRLQQAERQEQERTR